MSKLELKIPPPIVAVMSAAITWLLSMILPHVVVSASLRILVVMVFALLGVVFSMAGMAAFRHAQTTVNPMKPDTASALVTSGIYRISRNPMYVGLLLLLIAWAVFLASPIALAGPGLFIAYLNRFQIQAEERALTVRFGRSYELYKSSTRRWI